MSSTSRFLQGIYDFEGRGIHEPFLLDPALEYIVPEGSEAQFVYFRGGNTSPELVCAIVMRDGEPMRYFPMGARDGTHAPLAGGGGPARTNADRVVHRGPRGCHWPGRDRRRTGGDLTMPAIAVTNH